MRTARTTGTPLEQLRVANRLSEEALSLFERPDILNLNINDVIKAETMLERAKGLRCSAVNHWQNFDLGSTKGILGALREGLQFGSELLRQDSADGPLNYERMRIADHVTGRANTLGNRKTCVISSRFHLVEALWLA